MLLNLIERKRKNFFKNLGNVMAAVFKCALKLFTVTFISTENASKTATISVSYVTLITP